MVRGAEVTGRELDAAILREVIGFSFPVWQCRICGFPLATEILNGCIVDNCSMRPVPSRRADEPPEYSRDLSACHRAEVAIEQRGQHVLSAYVAELCRAVGMMDQARLLIYADAETRCRAMLAAVRETRNA